ncbi:MAG: Crp/Fnr family transcriptional regulator [Burkholderiales bacterium PBB1]|nr:MAG: Crp/Fnr family transcriptional regulator [Burkholderiales bacterium PBB1]
MAARRAALDISQSAHKNGLLARLPEASWQRWLPQLEWVDLSQGQVLHESGESPRHAYFPTTAILSLLNVTQDGASTEIAAVGNEGMVGVSLFMGGASTCSRAVVQSAGFGLRLKAQAMRAEFESDAQVMQMMLRYTHALMTQMGQMAVCNRHHSIDQQLCRCLLFNLDRLGGHEIVMTHELIASTLGVRREGVTETALKLQAAGLIRYARGRITVLDRGGLERRACECYAVVRKEYDRLRTEKLAA